MSRAFGSTPNGSLPAYGAEGEMSTYLNGRRQVAMRGLGAVPKPKMQPATKGEVMESTEISTRFGWGAVFVVKDGNGYYICEHYCPSSKRVVRSGKYPTMAEAKASCERVKSQLRNKGKVTGLSGLNGYSNMGFVSRVSEPPQHSLLVQASFMLDLTSLELGLSSEPLREC
jgi:hypothetical protein